MEVRTIPYTAGIQTARKKRQAAKEHGDYILIKKPEAGES